MRQYAVKVTKYEKLVIMKLVSIVTLDSFYLSGELSCNHSMKSSMMTKDIRLVTKRISPNVMREIIH